MNRTRSLFGFASAPGFARATRFGPVLLASALGCGPSPEELANGDDPLRALEASVRSEKYDAAFWAEEARSASSQWNQAIEKCSEPEWTGTPGCAVIRERQAAVEAEAAAALPSEEVREEPAPEDSGAEPTPAEAPDAERAAPGGAPTPGSAESAPPPPGNNANPGAGTSL
jgi:hypothetical protein